MEDNSRGATAKNQPKSSAMLSSPSAGGRRIAGNYARGSPGVVRRASSKPIAIIRSTSVPGQLQDRSLAGDPEAGGGSGGKTTSRRGLHFRDRSLQHDFNISGAGARHGIAQSLPPPQAPLLAGSLPPSRFLDDLPPLSLGPQASVESFTSECGALSTSLKTNRLYAASCPANLGAHFGRPPGSKISSMPVLEEGSPDEEEAREGRRSTEPKSITALSILESFSSAAGQKTAAPADGSAVDAESVESADSGAEELHVEDDVFDLELDGDLEALSLSERGKDV